MPVVVLTTSKEPDDVSRCYELGASSYVKKPLGMDQRVEAARAIKAYWLQLVEFPA